MKLAGRTFDGSFEEDHTDIPFIRKFGEDCSIPPYYGNDGKPIDHTYFRTKFKPNK